MKPFFEENCGDAESLVKYREMLTIGSAFIEEKMVRFGDEIITLCVTKAKGDNRRVHFALVGLARLLLSYLDAVNVLLGKGCIEGCLPLLRPMLEAYLGIAHIVQDKHEERALAYELARHKRRLKELRIGDKTHQDGQRLAAELKSDSFAAGIHDKMPKDLPERATVVEARIADPVFVPILAEWERLKRPLGKGKAKDPEWFALFGGGNSVRELAKNLGSVSLYVFMYKELSNPTHAGNALEVFADIGGDLADMRQLRHPWGYHKVLRGIVITFMLSFDKFLGFYDAEQQKTFQRYSAKDIIPRFNYLWGTMRRHLPTWYSVE